MPAGVKRSAILVVDDDPFSRAAMVSVLEEDGHILTAVGSSFDCLRLVLGGATFDLIIIDVVMPPTVPHGFALGRMLRHRNRDQKLLYVTGHLDALPSGELTGANAPILVKPIRALELQDAVWRALQEEGTTTG